MFFIYLFFSVDYDGFFAKQCENNICFPIPNIICLVPLYSRYRFPKFLNGFLTPLKKKKQTKNFETLPQCNVFDTYVLDSDDYRNSAKCSAWINSKYT